MKKIILTIVSILLVNTSFAKTISIKVEDKANTKQWVKISFNLKDDRKLVNYEVQGHKASKVQVKNAIKGKPLSSCTIELPVFEGQNNQCKFKLNYYDNKFVYAPSTTTCRENFSFNLRQ